MAKSLRPFFHRAPRYKLNPEDNRILRFAREKMPDQTFSTEIINVSTTGMAFNIERQLAPQIGETIKVEFSTEPGEESIAWFARVVRIEMPEEQAAWKNRSNMVRIGIRFESLPSGHANHLATQLRAKFEKLIYAHRQKRNKRIREWLAYNWLQVTLMALMAIGTAITLYILSRPSPNYDPRNPTIWGERFK